MSSGISGCVRFSGPRPVLLYPVRSLRRGRILRLNVQFFPFGVVSPERGIPADVVRADELTKSALLRRLAAVKALRRHGR